MSNNSAGWNRLVTYILTFPLFLYFRFYTIPEGYTINVRLFPDTDHVCELYGLLFRSNVVRLYASEFAGTYTYNRLLRNQRLHGTRCVILVVII